MNEITETFATLLYKCDLQTIDPTAEYTFTDKYV